MASIAPLYATSSDFIEPFGNGPFGGSLQIYYNINSHIAAGLFTHGAVYSGSFTESTFGNVGLAGKYIINPNSRFKFYGGLILSQTFVYQDVDDLSPSENSQAIKDLLTYDENKFTVGVMAGLEIKIINAISFTLQVSQQDIFGAFADEYVIHAGNYYPNPSNGYLYVAPGTSEAYTYVPFYVSGGLIFKFGKKKM